MRLISPTTRQSRPITDRVKESLFNVLANYGLPRAGAAADLFCGVGSLGLEALSRGARHVTFVEKDPATFAVLKRNIQKAGFIRQARTLRADAFTTEPEFAFNQQKCDLVFVDPPYAAARTTGRNSRLAALLGNLQQELNAAALVIVRTEKETTLLPQYGTLHIIDRRQWGSMAVTLLQKTDQAGRKLNNPQQETG